MPVQRRCLNEACSFNKKGKFNANSDSCRDCSYNIEETLVEKPKMKKNIYVPLILLIVFLAVTIVLIYKSYDANNETMVNGSITNSAQEPENKEAKIGFGLFQNKQNETILTVNGSETMGSEMMPLIIENYFKSKGATNIKINTDEKSKKIAVDFNLPDKQKLQSVYINMQDSKSAFEALLRGQCNLVMSSRRISAEELAKFKSAGLGNLSAYYAENVISLEAAVVIVNSSNSIAALDRSQLAAIFTGQITDWSQVGGKPGKINLYSPSANSELYGTFKALVAGDKPFAPNVKELAGMDKVAQEVEKDNNAIAFLNIPSAGKNKVLAISEGENPPVFPNEMNIATEDYPLSNRLYLYCSSSYKSSYSRELIDFALSEEGQNCMPKAGFISNNIRVEAVKVNQDAAWENNALKERHMQIVNSAEGRLNLNFRFDKNTAVLDNKALKDIERVVRFLNSDKYSEHKIILIGFADNTGDYNTNLHLSEGRANEVKKQLIAKDPNLEMRITKQWFGREQPIASNADDEGRNKNRRVEVWLVKK